MSEPTMNTADANFVLERFRLSTPEIQEGIVLRFAEQLTDAQHQLAALEVDNAGLRMQNQRLSQRIGFNELANIAASDLPDGWEIVLRVEKDSGIVELFNPDGVEVVSSVVEPRIEDEFAQAIRIACGEV